MSEEFKNKTSNDNSNNETINEYGNVKISDDVVAIIAGVAATEIPGVVSMSGGLTGGFSEILGMKNLSKGVKVELRDNDALIDVFIVVEYGLNISEIGKKVQTNVKSSVETMTELNVVEVNVNIQGVNIPKEKKEEEDSKVK